MALHLKSKLGDFALFEAVLQGPRQLKVRGSRVFVFRETFNLVRRGAHSIVIISLQ